MVNIEITDANGCGWSLDTPDVTIEVLAQRPSVSFNCPRSLSMLEGGQSLLPLTLTGR
jgi:nucleoporin POM152